MVLICIVRIYYLPFPVEVQREFWRRTRETQWWCFVLFFCFWFHKIFPNANQSISGILTLYRHIVSLKRLLFNNLSMYHSFFNLSTCTFIHVMTPQFTISPSIHQLLDYFIYMSTHQVLPSDSVKPLLPPQFCFVNQRFTMLAMHHCGNNIGTLVNVAEEEPDEWGGRTGWFQVSNPIGVRGWRIDLPKQTAQRNGVLHLSLRIIPLSHLLVLQHPISTTHHSKCKQPEK